MAISTNSSILIQGNTFDTGNSSPTGGIAYQTVILLNLDANAAGDPADSNGPGYAVVNSNYLTGIVSNGTHIVVNSGSANITNNIFIGPGSTQNPVFITAYIDVSGSQVDQVITNNIFDSPTVDSLSTNERLVIGPNAGMLTPNSIYHSNKNQTSYLPISKVPNLIDFYHNDNSNLAGHPTQAFYLYDSDPTAVNVPRLRSKYGSFSDIGSMVPLVPPISGPTIYYAAAEGTEVLWDTLGTTANIKYTFTMDVEEYLPPNVQILNFVIGLSAGAGVTGGGSSATNLQVLTNGSANSSYTMWVNSSISIIPTVTYDATNIATVLSNSLADVKNAIISGPPGGSERTTILTVVQSAPGTNQVTPAQLAAATQYLFIDVSSLPQFYTVVPNTRITVTYQAITEADATQSGLGITAPGYVDIYESPLIVK